VGLLLIVMYTVVNSVTEQEKAVASEEAVRGALIQFDALEDIQRQLADRMARPFVEGVHATARLAAVVRGGSSDDLADWAGDIAYDFEREGLLGELLVTLTDEAEMARGPLAQALVGIAGSPDPVDAFAEDINWRISSVPLIEGDPALGQRVIAVPLDSVVAPFRRITNALLTGVLWLSHLR